MATLRTLNRDTYAELSSKIGKDVDSETAALESKNENCQFVYTLIGGKLAKDGFPLAGKSLKKLSYDTYLAIFGEKDYKGNTLYNARVAYGLANGESNLDSDGKATSNAQVHTNARKYLERIRYGVRKLVDPSMCAWPAKPQTPQAKKKMTDKERNRQARIATDPKFAAQERVKAERIENVERVMEDFDSSLLDVQGHIARIEKGSKEALKGQRAKISDENIAILVAFTKALEDVSGVFTGRLATRKMPSRKKEPKKRSKK